MSVAIRDIVGKVPYHNKTEKVADDDDQDVPEIIKYICLCHKETKQDYDEISEQFWKGNAKDTAQYIFDFLKKNVVYKVEPESFQSVRTPGVIVHLRHGDCKHYALFTTGIVDSLRRRGYPIKAKYRFVSDAPDREVHHVFSVVTDLETKTEYWVDPVLKTFNRQPDFYKVKDVDMAIYKLSGTDQYAVAQVGDSAEIGNIFQKFAHSMDVNFSNLGKSVKTNTANITKDIKTATAAVQHGVQVNAQNLAHGVQVNAQNLAHGVQVDAQNLKKGVNIAVHDVGTGVKNTAKAVKTATVAVAALPARKAFLSLVALNVHSFATDLAAGDQNAIKKKWEGAGGEWKVLDQAIHNGKSRKSIGILGVDDAAIFTWLALASAMIGIFAQFLHHAKGNNTKVTAQAQEGVANVLSNAYAAATGGTYDAGSSNVGAMSITPGVDDSGTPYVDVHDISSTGVNANGDIVPGTYDSTGTFIPADNGTTLDENGNVVKTGPGAFDIAWGKAVQFFKDHEGPVIAVTVTALAAAAYSGRKKRGKR